MAIVIEYACILWMIICRVVSIVGVIIEYEVVSGVIHSSEGVVRGTANPKVDHGCAVGVSHKPLDIVHVLSIQEGVFED